MRKRIIDSFPPVIRQIKEFGEIAQSFDLEFEKLEGQTARVLRNMFLDTADEDGISRFESLFGIYPAEGMGIEERKQAILYRLNRRKMSFRELEGLLSGHKGGVCLIPDFEGGFLTAAVGLDTSGLHEVYVALDEALPLSVCILFEMSFFIWCGFLDSTQGLEFTCTVYVWDLWGLDTGAECLFSVKTDETFQTEVEIRKDLWRLNGLVKLDGSRKMDAEIYEGSGVWHMGKPVTTRIAKRKILLARAGAQGLPKITQMAFGSGGLNSNNEVLEADEGQESLHMEIFRKNIDKFEVLGDKRVCYYCTLGEDELVGEAISEIALVDADGDLIAIQNCAAKGKDSDWEITFKINDTM